MDEAFERFLVLDTKDQMAVLQRVGLDTEVADRLLGQLAGRDQLRYHALMRRVDICSNYGYAAAMAA